MQSSDHPRGRGGRSSTPWSRTRSRSFCRWSSSALLFLAIKKYVVPSFEKTFAERTAAIEGGIAAAEAKQAEADARLAELEQRLGEARHEAARIREEAREQGAADRRRRCASRRRPSRRGSSSTARRRSRPSASRRSPRCGRRWAALATSLAGRIVGESLEDDARSNRVVERFLADLETLESARARR